MIKRQLKNWGGSTIFAIPVNLLQHYDLKTGDNVGIIPKKDGILIKKVGEKSAKHDKN